MRCRKRYRAWISLANIAKLLTSKHKQETTANNLPHGRDVMAVFPTRYAKTWFLPCFTVCAHQTRIVVYENQYRYFAVIIDDQIFWNNIAELLSNGIAAWCFMSFCCLRTSIALALLSAGSSRWNYEVQKLFLFYVHRHGTHDQMMCLIFLFLDQFQISGKVSFWNPSRLEALKRFWMEMFKLSEFDLERTTTRSTIIVYTSLDSFLDRLCPSPSSSKHRIAIASDSFVLIASTVSQWRFPANAVLRLERFT